MHILQLRNKLECFSKLDFFTLASKSIAYLIGAHIESRGSVLDYLESKYIRLKKAWSDKHTSLLLKNNNYKIESLQNWGVVNHDATMLRSMPLPLAEGVRFQTKF